MNRALLSEIIQEAYMMGRIYEQRGAKVGPAIEFQKVEEMAERFLKRNDANLQAAVEAARAVVKRAKHPGDIGLGHTLFNCRVVYIEVFDTLRERLEALDDSVGSQSNKKDEICERCGYPKNTHPRTTRLYSPS